MAVNPSKKRDPRSWKKWADSGSLGNWEDAVRNGLEGRNLYQEMVDSEPGTRPEFTALSLTDPAEMRAFFESMVEHYREHGDTADVRENAEQIVRENMAYAASSGSDPSLYERWDAAIGITHPYFGEEANPHLIHPLAADLSGRVSGLEYIMRN